MPTIDMTGRRFGMLVVIKKAGTTGSAQHTTWECLCDCGNRFVTNGASIRAGRTSSCGCQSSANMFSSASTRTHGMSLSRTYRVWAGMIARCKQRNHKKAHLYSLKGIRVCEEWKSFDGFFADMGEAPAGMSIDRKDSSLGYSKENCRWATPVEQGNNTSANHLLSFNGEEMTISMWARKRGIKANTLIYRIKRGWSVKEALTTKVQRRRHASASKVIAKRSNSDNL